MKKALLATAAFGLIYTASPVQAGFEFEPAPEPVQSPVRLPEPPAPAPEGFSVDPAPVMPVEAQPLSPEPVMIAPNPPPVDVPAQTAKPTSLVINPYPNQPQAGQSDDQLLLQEMLKETGSLKPLPNLPQDIQKKYDQSHPVPPSYVRKRDFAEVQGFGRDLPLVIALSQVVPADYTYSFTNQDDAGSLASWQGGRPWDQVLAEMLQPLDLSADIRGNRVMIVQGANTAPQAPMVVQASMPAPAPLPTTAPMKMQPVMDEEMDLTPVPLPPASDYVAPAPMIEEEPSSTAIVSRSSDLMASSHADLGDSPRPVVPARISRMRMEQGDVPEPHAMEHTDSRVEQESAEYAMTEPVTAEPLPPVERDEPKQAVPLAPIPLAPAQDDLQPAQPMIVAEEKQPASQPLITHDPAPSMTMEPIKIDPEPLEQMPQKSKAWQAPSELKMASVPSFGGSLDNVRTWRAVRGDSLKTVLTDWSMDAGVELYWSSEFDYPLDSSVRLKGTFEEAVQNILTGLRDARPRPVGRLHPNEPEGPAVLVIETQQIVE